MPQDLMLNTLTYLLLLNLRLKIMSSPSLRKHSASPIRNLDDRSPRRNPKLHTILEEQPILSRPLGLLSNVLERQNSALNLENRVLNDKIRNYADETTRFVFENSRLKHQNQALKDLTYTTSVISVEKLNREIFLKDAEIEKLRNDMGLLKASYQRNLDHFRLENEGLKNQLVALQSKRFAETEEIKVKYNAIIQEDISLARKGYLEDISRLMNNLEATKALLGEKELEIKHLTTHGQNLVREHSVYLEQLVSENNILRNQILQIEIKRDNEVKQAETKKELEKSRTHGIIAFCKQNTAFIEKEISKLAEELLEKSISIEQFTKDMVKIKRNLEQTEKRYEDRIFKIQTDCEDRLQEKDNQIQKVEKHCKEEIADMKKVQMELQEVISRKEHELNVIERENDHNKQVIQQKNQQIENLKANLSKLHDEHAKQISKVMTDSRIKRKSMRNLSQSSSLRDLSADSSSVIKKPIERRNSIAEQQAGSSGQLYTVHQQLAASQLVHNEEDEDIAMKDLVLHYQNIIQELKNNKALELNLANETIQKLNQGLREKQQEVLEILQRFSPLMEYKLNPASIEQERKEKILKHYKANIDILSVMLDKYSIAAVSKNK